MISSCFLRRTYESDHLWSLCPSGRMSNLIGGAGNGWLPRPYHQQVESLRSILDYPMRYLKGKAERSALLFLSLVSLLVTERVSLIPGCEWDRTPVAFSFPNLAGIKADFFIPMWFLVLHWFKLEGGREIGALLNLKNICLGQLYMQQYLIVEFVFQKSLFSWML